MSATLNVAKAVKQVEEAVEKIVNDGDQNFPEAANIGDTVRQGDVYIQLIEPVTSTPVFYTRLNNPEFPVQLAPGNTKGSRHMLENSAGIEVYTCNASRFIDDEDAERSDDFFDLEAKFNAQIQTYVQNITGENDTDANRWGSVSRGLGDKVTNSLALSGPIIVLKNPGVISHPEHGNWNLCPGSYRIVFQRTIDANMRVRRVFD
jgi:hypothetical protein